MPSLIGLALAAALAAPSPGPSPSPDAVPDPTAILDRAIKAAGGEAALRRAAVLRWRGQGAVHAGEQAIRIEGRWIVQPPERAVVATWEKEKGPQSTRRLAVLGASGWMERGGAREPMPAAMLASERDQLDLYALIRLIPLRDPGVRLTATGPRSLRVERAGRPPVAMVFDGSGRLDRMRTQVRHAETGRLVDEEITLEGEVSAGGIRWPLRLFVTQDGAPFFDLELTDFGIGSAGELEKEAARR